MYDEGDNFRLQPANPTKEPDYFEKEEIFEILGHVVMVIRQK